MIPKTGGSGYRLDFGFKVAIQHSNGVGATAKTLVSGIKDITLIDGGQGYTSYNPPIAIVGAPTGGTLAKVALTVDDESGQVDSLTIMNSGSGYDFIPAISFVNPGGCKIGQPTIDSEGRVNIDSIVVEEQGLNYSNPPIVYLDEAPEGGINAQAISRINQDGQVYEIVITNRGRGYVTPPRARIIQPIGAQVLDVTVASGAVTNIEMLTGGRGYTDAPSVYIVDDRKDPMVCLLVAQVQLRLQLFLTVRSLILTSPTSLDILKQILLRFTSLSLKQQEHLLLLVSMSDWL